MENLYTSTKQEKLKGAICAIGLPFLRLGFNLNSSLVNKGVIHQDDRFEKIRAFKDKHNGERVFIVATGPSLTMNDLKRLKNEYTISMNSIVSIFPKTDFRPTYYMCSDGLVYKKIVHAQTLMRPEDVFIGIGNINTKWNIQLSDVGNIEDKNINLFHVDRTKTLKNVYSHKDEFSTEFSFDAYKEIIDGGTITFCAMQMAAYMGFKEIYLLGVDCNYLGAKTHFAEGEYSASSGDVNKLSFTAFQQQKAYECVKNALEGTDIKIFNATRGGMLEIYPRVDFDTLF